MIKLKAWLKYEYKQRFIGKQDLLRFWDLVEFRELVVSTFLLDALRRSKVWKNKIKQLLKNTSKLVKGNFVKLIVGNGFMRSTIIYVVYVCRVRGPQFYKNYVYSKYLSVSKKRVIWINVSICVPFINSISFYFHCFFYYNCFIFRVSDIHCQMCFKLISFAQSILGYFLV